MRFSRFRTLGVAIVCSAALGLSACSEVEPRADYISDPKVPITIAARVDRPDHMVMATLFQRALYETGYESTVRVVGDPADDPEAWFTDPTVDLFTVCTGAMLADTAPQMVEPLLDEIHGGTASGKPATGNTMDPPASAVETVDDPGDVAAAELTLETLAGTLPEAFETTDPSPTSGCNYDTGYKYQEELPQNLVAIFRKIKLDRYAQDAITVIIRLITEEDLEELVADTRDPSTLREVVNAWFDANIGHMEKSPNARV